MKYLIIATLMTIGILGGLMSSSAAEPVAPKFTAGPTAVAEKAGVRIEFAVSKKTDVVVEILDAKGETVRHLVAGVLGEKVPEPLKKGSLKQSLLWDRKDDLGKLVPVGKYTVRVGLELTPKLKKLENFQPLQFGAVSGVAALPKGGVCVYSNTGYLDYAAVILALDSKGAYQRSVYPPPATIEPAKSPGLPGFRRGDGKWVPRLDENRMSLRGRGRPRFSPMTMQGDVLYVCPHTDGGIYAINTATGTVAAPVGGKVLGWGKDKIAPRAMVVSADGKWVYFTAVKAIKPTYKPVKFTPLHVVYRMPLDGSSPPVPFIGKPDQSGAGELLNMPFGLSIDKVGNLYVCDNGNDRVAVFKPDGKLARSVKVSGPALSCVDPADGTLFVLSSSNPVGGNPGVTMSKVKVEIRVFSAAGKPAGSVAVTASRAVGRPVVTGMTLEKVGDGALLWVSLAGTKWPTTAGALLRYEFGKKGLAVMKPISTNNRKRFNTGPYDPRSFYGWGGAYPRYDEALDWKYYPDEGRLHYSVGELAKKGVWADGNRYGWKKNNRNWYKIRDKWPELAFQRFSADGKSMPYKASGSNELKLVHKPKGPWFPQRGVMVDRRGHVFMRYSWENAEAKKKALDLRNQWVTGILHFDETGKLVGQVALTHGTFGMGTDIHGDIYVGDKPRPAGVLVPADIEKAFGGKVPESISREYGSVIKFGPKGGGFLFNKGKPKETEPRRPGDLYKPPLKSMDADIAPWLKGGQQARIEGAKWVWVGMSPMPSTRGCICYGTSLAADPHGRVFAPDKMACRVAVLDSAGNLIRYIGSYGNMDSRGKGSRVPDPEIAFAAIRMVTFATSRQVRVADNWNMWVSVINLEYAVEKKSPVSVSR